MNIGPECTQKTYIALRTLQVDAHKSMTDLFFLTKDPKTKDKGHD